MSEENVQATTETVETAPEGGTEEKTSKLTELEKDDLIEIVQNLRKENAAKRTKNRDAERELEEFKAWKESQKTELQKAQERAEELSKKNYSLLKTSIAFKAGLSEDDIDFIHGETEDEMRASAEKLAARVKPSDDTKVTPKVTDVFAGARGGPVPAGPKDTKTIANQWLAGLVFKD